eukprot:GHVO01017979.1.p2 GENE.GHVO01017979.1~~GHVO01017979.1.p2  ORF type:complete len:116 (+),score=4.83 GHVO01017979.1:569-916(+)
MTRWCNTLRAALTVQRRRESDATGESHAARDRASKAAGEGLAAGVREQRQKEQSFQGLPDAHASHEDEGSRDVTATTARGIRETRTEASRGTQEALEVEELYVLFLVYTVVLRSL